MPDRINDIFNEPHSYRRNLPHIQPVNAYYFITARLAGSIPRSKLIKIQHEKEEFERGLSGIKNDNEREKLKREFHRNYFKKYDEALDKILIGPTWLRDDRVAGIVAEAIRYRDDNKYDLLAYTIMPNHIHLVFWLGEEFVMRNDISHTRNTVSRYNVAKIMQSLKMNAAIKSNRILKRSGQFWARESYDHIVRNKQEMIRTVKYVLNNPVKAGFVGRPEDWKWNYCKAGLRLW